MKYRKSRQRKFRKSRKNRKTRRLRKGGALHPASTVIMKPDDESPFLMTNVETMKNIVETQYI